MAKYSASPRSSISSRCGNKPKLPEGTTHFDRNAIARNTLANANAVRDWRIYADLAQHLIGIARRLYADDPLALELDETVYALDSTTIDLCLSVFPWAPFRSTKAAVAF